MLDKPLHASYNANQEKKEAAADEEHPRLILKHSAADKSNCRKP